MRTGWLRMLPIALLVLLLLIIALVGLRRLPTGPTSTPPGTTIAAQSLATATQPYPTQATPRRQTTPTATGTQRNSVTVTAPSRTRAPTPTIAVNSLPIIDFAQLPKEAQETIRLIDQGGPFPYDRDGIVFGNRERLLPLKPDGYYHEYTVITPGSADRGARRIIAGEQGELYYTDDHYESFKRVRRQ